jgi:hypothetical protein
MISGASWTPYHSAFTNTLSSKRGRFGLSSPESVLSPSLSPLPTSQFQRDALQFRQLVHDQDYLPSPPDAVKRNIELFPTDHLLELSPPDKAFLAAKNLTYTTPRNLLLGLKGSESFNFTKQMTLSKIPFIAGSGLLVGTYAFGGGSTLARNKALAGTLMFGLGNLLANVTTGTLYRARWGYDVDQVYLKGNKKDTEKALISSDFPRTDLLTNDHYEALRGQFDIPRNIADPKDAVRDQLRIHTSNVRVLRALMGSLFGAVGAGYLAASDHWGGLWTKDQFTLNPFNHASRAHLRGIIRGVAHEKFVRPAELLLSLAKSTKPLDAYRRLPDKTLGQLNAFLVTTSALSGISALTLWRILQSPPSLQYEPSLPKVPATTAPVPTTLLQKSLSDRQMREPSPTPQGQKVALQ